jgi:hypothetical protein
MEARLPIRMRSQDRVRMAWDGNTASIVLAAFDRLEARAEGPALLQPRCHATLCEGRQRSPPPLARPATDATGFALMSKIVQVANNNAQVGVGMIDSK